MRMPLILSMLASGLVWALSGCPALARCNVDDDCPRGYSCAAEGRCAPGASSASSSSSSSSSGDHGSSGSSSGATDAGFILVTRAPGGLEGDGPSGHPSVSQDGEVVAFESEATNLVERDNNGQRDVFVFRRSPGTITRVSLTLAGAELDVPCGAPVVSADGKAVAFECGAAGAQQVHLRRLDTTLDVREGLVSSPDGGLPGDAPGTSPAIAPDGRQVAFESRASNLLDRPDAPLAPQVLLWTNGALSLASRTPDGGYALGASAEPSLALGGAVAFRSAAPRLVVTDVEEDDDIFVAGADGRLHLITAPDRSVPGSQNARPSISSDGTWLAFESADGELGAEDGGVGARTHILLAELSATDPPRYTRVTAGANGNSSHPSLAVTVDDDVRVAFESLASNLAPDDANGARDLFVWSRRTRRVSAITVATQLNAGTGLFTASLSPRGQWLTFRARRDSGPFQIYLVPVP